MKTIIAVAVALILAAGTFGSARAESAGDKIAQGLDQAQDTISKGVGDIASGLGDIVKSFDADKLGEKPNRDLLTLGIGGVAGYAAGAVVSGLGLFSIDLIGISMIPVAGALAGLYLANEGYFDDLRSAFE